MTENGQNESGIESTKKNVTYVVDDLGELVVREETEIELGLLVTPEVDSLLSAAKDAGVLTELLEGLVATTIQDREDRR